MKLTIEVTKSQAKAILANFGNAKTGPFIDRCRCPGCLVLRKVLAEVRRQA